MNVPPAFAALFAPPKQGANGNMLSSETTTPLAAAAFIAAVNFLHASLAEGPDVPTLLRARAAELTALADLVEIAQAPVTAAAPVTPPVTPPAPVTPPVTPPVETPPVTPPAPEAT